MVVLYSLLCGTDGHWKFRSAYTPLIKTYKFVLHQLKLSQNTLNCPIMVVLYSLLCGTDGHWEYCRFYSPAKGTCDFEWKRAVNDVRVQVIWEFLEKELFLYTGSDTIVYKCYGIFVCLSTSILLKKFNFYNFFLTILGFKNRQM